ncbi:MAG: thioredoxin family protein [Eubacteriales bacterium]|nr:thioredoxin family protein [Eubacteriales bacterium]
MKKLVVLCGENCGYCKKAKMLLRRALEKEPKYIAIDIQFVLVESDTGRQYVHSLVPAFFCNNQMLYEGNPDMDIITSILEECYE